MLVVAVRDKSSHQEVHENNSAYEEIDITHFAEASKGPKLVITLNSNGYYACLIKIVQFFIPFKSL